MTLDKRIYNSIGSISTEQWQTLDLGGYPFAQYAFFQALEQSGVVGDKTGWLPQYIALFDENGLAAVAPCFIKLHPYGEYVFDWSWAEAYEQHGLEYYPKTICAIPFTPATGPRFLLRPGTDNIALIHRLVDAMKEITLTINGSGFHLLFPDKSISDDLVDHKMMQRRDVQFHWFNRGFPNFDAFLGALSSRKRKAIRKERKSVIAQNVEVTVKEGCDASEQDWEDFYRFYRLTYLKRSGHNGYLNLAFFRHLAKNMADNLVLVLASIEGENVAGALYVKSGSVLYGRYWGCSEALENLHFELCYYQGIDYCIRHGLQTFNAGAQGEHKLARGFEPVFTYSNHQLLHPDFNHAIGDFLLREAPHIDQYHADACSCLPFKSHSDL